MATVKRLSDLTSYTEVLPYAIYQPLLGWKSKRIAERFRAGFEHDKGDLLDRLKSQFSSDVTVSYADDCTVKIELRPGSADSHAGRRFDSALLEEIAKNVPDIAEADPAVWAGKYRRRRESIDGLPVRTTDRYIAGAPGTIPD